MTTTTLRPQTWDLYPWRGDDLSIDLTFPDGEDAILYDSDGNIIGVDAYLDISAWELLAQVREYPNSPNILAAFTVEHTDVGRATITLTAAEMQSLPGRELAWDLQRTEPSVRTFFAGIFGVGADTSRSP